MSIKIENTQVFGWEAAIRGARNPMNSWEKSDSWFFDQSFPDEIMGISDVLRTINGKTSSEEKLDLPYGTECRYEPYIGPNDHKLLMNLCKGGTEESKWRRMVHVQFDITAPLYVLKELDTYKVGTVSNSCSTMHKIQAKEFTLDDFSHENLITWEELADQDDSVTLDKLVIYDIGQEDYGWEENDWRYEDDYYGDPTIATWPEQILKITIAGLNYYREKFIETKDKKYWWQMIQLLPSSYNQKRTIDLNYEVLAAQYRQRKGHKLTEWAEYLDWIRGLPYSEFITMEE